jgi:hypothetical protein
VLVDRAAFLTFEVQPVEEQFTLIRYLILGGVVMVTLLILAGFIFALRARRRRTN